MCQIFLQMVIKKIILSQFTIKKLKYFNQAVSLYN